MGMKRGVVLLLAVVKFALSWLTGCSEIPGTWLPSQQFSSLLPNKDVALVVDVDGKFILVDSISRKIVWSYSSNLPIYSSYQKGDAFVDCGDDWHLYFYRNGSQIMKVPMSAEDYVRSTPIVGSDGGVTLGSRKTTVFVVDALSGKLIRTYKLPDSPSPSDSAPPVDLDTIPNSLMLNNYAQQFVEPGAEDINTVDHLLYIKRTDYALQHHSPVDGRTSWSVSFAEFDASFEFMNIGNELGAPRKKKPVIMRIRDRSLMDSLSTFDSILHGLPAPRPIPLPSSSSPSSDHSLVPWSFADIPAPQQVRALPGNTGSNIGETVLLSLLAGTISRYHLQYAIPILLISLSLIGIILYRYSASRKLKNLNKDADEVKVQGSVPKKKKNRKLGNKKINPINENNHDGGGEMVTLADAGNSNANEKKIGKLVLSRNEIAKGSNGTVILEGVHDGRPVAVKRLVRTHHDAAFKEIQNLIASDKHPNVVRWYGVEEDQDFVYLALERCTCSLNDLICLYSESFQCGMITKGPESEVLDDYTLRLRKIKENNKDAELWKPNGYPTLQLLKLMRDMVSGIVHLHEIGIIHRDLKPQNVLINKDRFLSAKLSDMGISKRVPENMSSVTMHATGYGSSGWQAPEQLLRQRQTRAVDLFSLGCVLFFCVTGGKHPYGDSIERDFNIVNNRKDLFLVDNMPEAMDLFTRLLDFDPDKRPKAIEVLHHPFFWSPETRLSFLRDASDRVELEDRDDESELLDALENTSGVALNGKWDEKLETVFINNIGRYRRYNYYSIRDLLRVIRNKLNHYRELPQDIQELLGSVPEGFDGYFAVRFPRLLIEVYKVMSLYCRDEEFFLKYTTSTII